MNEVQEIMMILIAQVFLAYVLWRFIRKIIYGQALVLKQYIGIILFSIGHAIVTILKPDIILYVLIIIVLAILLTIIQDISLKMKIVFASILVGLFCMGKFIFTIDGINNYLLTAGILMSLFIFESELIIETAACQLKRHPKSSEWYALCLIPIVSFVLLTVLEFYIELNVEIRIMAVIFTYWLNIFIFYFYETMLGYYQEVLDNHQTMFQQKLFETRMEHLYKVEKQMSAFRHDLKNHLFALNIMADQGETDKIKEYLQEMDIELLQSSVKSYTQNKNIDMLLNYFTSKAELSDAKLNIVTEIPPTMDWNIYDLNILLGNLIDNAIEAVSKTEDKNIDLELKFQRGLLKLKIQNPFNVECKIEDGRYVTTKEKEPENHGFGLENVSNIVDKYAGTMEISSENHRFDVKILLYQK